MVVVPFCLLALGECVEYRTQKAGPVLDVKEGGARNNIASTTNRCVLQRVSGERLTKWIPGFPGEECT